MTKATYANWIAIPNGADEAQVQELGRILREELVQQAAREGFAVVAGVESHRSQQNRELFPPEEQLPHDEILVVSVYVEAA